MLQGHYVREDGSEGTKVRLDRFNPATTVSQCYAVMTDFILQLLFHIHVMHFWLYSFLLSVRPTLEQGQSFQCKRLKLLFFAFALESFALTLFYCRFEADVTREHNSVVFSLNMNLQVIFAL